MTARCLPRGTKEVLTIGSEVSILYSVIPAKAPDLLREVGPTYERDVVLPMFRSAVSDVSSRFFAKDMHTGQRSVIEQAIKEQMMTNLVDRGIQVEAEQQTQRMEFVLQEERQEPERKRVQAEGVRDAQRIISEGLNPMISTTSRSRPSKNSPTLPTPRSSSPTATSRCR